MMNQLILYLLEFVLSFSGVLDSWFMKNIVNSTKFLVKLPPDAKSKWTKDKGKTVNEAIREGAVSYVGKPIYALLQ